MILNFLLKNRSPKQTAAKNTFWLTGAEGIAKLSSLLTTLLIARGLGVETYGKYSFALALTALFAIPVDFGFNTLVNKEVAGDYFQAGKLLLNTSLLKLLLGGLTFGLMAATLAAMGKNGDVRVLAYLLMPYAIIQSFILFFQSFFRAYEKMEWEALTKVWFYLTVLAATYVTVRSNLGIRRLVELYIGAALMTVAAEAAILSRKISLKGLPADFRTARKILKGSAWYALAALLMTGYFKIDVTILSALANDKSVGLYSADYNFVLVLNIIPSVVLPAIFPIIARKFRQGDVAGTGKIYKATLKYLAAAAVICLAAVIPAAGKILALAFGREFIQASPILWVLLTAGGIMVVDRAGIDLLNATGRQKTNVKMFAASLLFNVAANLALIPRYREMGAAVSTLVTEIMLFLMVLYTTRRYLMPEQILK